MMDLLRWHLTDRAGNETEKESSDSRLQPREEGYGKVIYTRALGGASVLGDRGKGYVASSQGRAPCSFAGLNGQHKRALTHTEELRGYQMGKVRSHIVEGRFFE